MKKIITPETGIVVYPAAALKNTTMLNRLYAQTDSLKCTGIDEPSILFPSAALIDCHTNQIFTEKNAMSEKPRFFLAQTR